MTVNERFLTLVRSEVGDDPTFGMLLQMFEGNVLSIPEEEFRATLAKYLRVLQGVLNE
jgi:hypothetical protein